MSEAVWSEAHLRDLAREVQGSVLHAVLVSPEGVQYEYTSLMPHALEIPESIVKFYTDDLAASIANMARG